MDEMPEGDDVVNVIDRLVARFPTLERDHIAAVVNEEHDGLGDAKVRDFVPVLVEHAATERLRQEAHPVMSTAEGIEEREERDRPPSLDPIEQQRRSEPPGGPLLGNAGGR